jgi:hypothetical protein
MAISPIVSPAHPSIRHLSCALLHPSTPSCLHAALTHHLTTFPSFLKFFTLLFAVFSLPRYQSFVVRPGVELSRLALRALRTAAFVTAAIGTSWGSVCLFQHLLSRNRLPTARWFLGGALGGCWAFLVRDEGRSQFMYSVRLSLHTAWKVGVKKGLWKGVRGGEVGLFVLALAAVGVVYEVDRDAVRGSVTRKGVRWLRGDERENGGKKRKNKENENENEK